jgi:hypothetical protein
MGLGARVSGAGRGARGLNSRCPQADPTAGTRRSNGSEEAGRGDAGRELAGRAASCLRPGRLRAALYRAVPRAGPTGRGGGPGTKRPSGRAGTRHYRSGLGSG